MEWNGRSLVRGITTKRAPTKWKARNSTDLNGIVRAILGLYNAFCILSFRNGVDKAFGHGAANWYILLQASQFHLMYYASRTLPNFFAFGLSR